jgi:hypothetical protein
MHVAPLEYSKLNQPGISSREKGKALGVIGQHLSLTAFLLRCVKPTAD